MSLNGDHPSLTLDGVHAEVKEVSASLTITNQTVARHGRVLIDHEQQLSERTGDREAVLSEPLNVKRDLSDARKIAQQETHEEKRRKLAEAVKERRWRAFWRIATPVMVAALVEAMRYLHLGAP